LPLPLPPLPLDALQRLLRLFPNHWVKVCPRDVNVLCNEDFNDPFNGVFNEDFNELLVDLSPRDVDASKFRRFI
jgi:hypothetical protein